MVWLERNRCKCQRGMMVEEEVVMVTMTPIITPMTTMKRELLE